MRIRCDHCSAEIDDAVALVEELEPGLLVWFCDATCRAEAQPIEEDEEEPHAETAAIRA